MSECTHDCSTCSSNCGSRQQPQSLLVPANALSDVKHVVGIVSGKGGVGKSLVTSMLAVLLQREGYKVGILDADITGPSIPKAFGMHNVEVFHERSNCWSNWSNHAYIQTFFISFFLLKIIQAILYTLFAKKQDLLIKKQADCEKNHFFTHKECSISLLFYIKELTMARICDILATYVNLSN